jgi:hypothetical protein
MPRWLKILLIVATSGVLLLGLSIGGLMWWLSSHRGELRAQGIEAEAQARRFAQGKNSTACIHEAIARLDSAKGFVEQAVVNVFFKTCLSSAERTAELCVDVPPTSELLGSATWRVQTCAALGKPSDNACGRLMGAIQEVCHGK